MPAFLRLLILVLLASSSFGQSPIPGLKLAADGKKTEPETGPTTEQLQSQLKDVRAQLAKLDQPDAEAKLPAGISAEMLAERKRDLDQTVRTLARVVTLRESLPEARKAAATARTTAEEWTHFTDKPPHSLLLVDDLENRRAAAADKAATSRSSLSLFDRSLENIAGETSAAEARIRELTAAATSAPDDAAVKWKLAAANERLRTLQARNLFVTANIDYLRTQLDTSETETKLLDRQIRITSKNAKLSDDDLAKIRKSTDDRITAIRKELTDVRNRYRTAVADRTKAKDAMDKAVSAEAAPGAEPDKLLAAQLETAETRADVLQFISENLDAYASLEDLTPEIYQKRREYLDGRSREQRVEALEGLKAYLDRITAWQTVAGNELAAVTADLGKQDSLSNLVTAGDPRLKTIAERREILWEKQQFLQRVIQSANFLHKNLGRWIGVFNEAERPKNLDTWLDDSWAKTKAVTRKIWTFEVTRVPTATGQQSIELGLVISAVLFFLIAYFIIGRLTRRLQTFAVGHGRIAEAQANTLRNWLMILAGVMLALTTLHLLKIPLTVFAFFGGALAIGLGFGTQTLIKNFISGIIVLFERRIRVGDIVDIGGLSGLVSEINTRSSVLKGPDGRETLVPNSVFLENSIVNLTLSNRTSRRTVLVGVEYGSPIQQVTSILTECADRHGLILKDPQPLVIFQDFAADSLLFKLYFWTAFDGKTNPEAVESDIRVMIHKRFGEAGIGFPFPQRDMHLKTSHPLRVEIAAKEESAGDGQPEAPRSLP